MSLFFLLKSFSIIYAVGFLVFMFGFPNQFMSFNKDSIELVGYGYSWIPEIVFFISFLFACSSRNGITLEEQAAENRRYDEQNADTAREWKSREKAAEDAREASERNRDRRMEI